MDKTLKGVRILSLALNLPGPAALMRCQQMGASCTKLEPPAKGAAMDAGGVVRSEAGGDPMRHYNPAAWVQMHSGIRNRVGDLKTEGGQALLHRTLERTDVLLTSFRPSALTKLGLGWKALHTRYPALSMVQIVGSSGKQAEAPGHDLTYLAENGLVTGLELPPTLYADMAGSLLAVEAILKVCMHRHRTGKGSLLQVALADAAAWLALPKTWGLTHPDAPVGGAHAGYRVYACKDGRVAVAALEPHFAKSLAALAGVPEANMLAAQTRLAIARFLAGKTRKQLDALAASHDIPLHTLA